MSSFLLKADSESKGRLEKLGIKFTPGGAHISRTMMLGELGALLVCAPSCSPAKDYREAVVEAVTNTSGAPFLGQSCNVCTYVPLQGSDPQKEISPEAKAPLRH